MPATPYTILREYKPYVTPYNLDLMKEVMLYKQEKVDTNRAALYQQIDLLMGQDIAKSEDREYLQDRMSETIGRINTMYHGADLSSDGITRHIQSEISSVLDDKVMNAISGTKEYRRMVDLLRKKQEDGDEDYSPINAEFALEPARQWLSDGQAGTALGTLQYSPYVDYQKQIDTAVTAAAKQRKGTTVTQPMLDANGNPTGRMVTITSDSLSAYDAGEMAFAALDARARNQIQIEAWYLAKSQPGAFTYDSAMSAMTADIDEAKKHLTALEGQKKAAGGDKAKIAQIDAQIEQVKNYVASQEETMRGMDPNTYSPYEAALAVSYARIRQQAGVKYAYDNSTYELSKDDAYYADADLKIRLEELGIKKQELLLKQYDSETKRIKATNGSGSSPGVGGFIVPYDVPYKGTPEDVEKTTTDRYKSNKEALGISHQRLLAEMDNADVASGKVSGTTRAQIESIIDEDLSTNGQASAYYGLPREMQWKKYFELNGGAANGLIPDDKVPYFEDFMTKANAMQQERDRLAEIEAANERAEQAVLVSEYNGDTDAFNRDKISHELLPMLRAWEDYRVYLLTGRTPSGYPTRVASPGKISAARERFLTALQDAQERLDAIGMGGYDLAAWFDIGEDAIHPMGGTSNAEEFKFIGDLIYAYSGLNSYSTRDLRVNTVRGKERYEDAVENNRDLQSEITAINQKYIDRNTGQGYSFSFGGATRQDIERAPANSMEGLYAVLLRNKEHPEQVPSNITGVTISRDPQVPSQYLMAPILETSSENSGGASYGDLGKYTVVVSPDRLQEALTNAGLSIDLSEQTLPIERYSTPVTQVKFRNKNSKNYAEGIAVNFGTNEVFNASMESTLAYIDDMYGPKAEASSSVSGDETGVTRRLNLTEAVKNIYDNSELFAVGQRGVVGEGVYLPGIEKRLYFRSPNNLNAPAEEILVDKVTGVEYADNMQKMFYYMPQRTFNDFVIAAVQEQITYWVKNPNETGLDPTGDLAKILSFINNYKQQ